MNNILLLNKKDNISSFQFIKQYKFLNDQGLKFLPYLLNKEKEYIFELTLGTQTDTGDYTGSIIKSCATKELNIEDINNVLNNFLYITTQVPNKFSAIKVNGERAYNLARQNIDFKLEERKIKVSYLELMSYTDNKITIKAVVSPGTYIRTLAEDIALKLDTCGHLTKLHRTSSNGFTLSTDEEIVNLNHLNTLFPSIICSSSEIQKLKNGLRISFDKPDGLHVVNDSNLNFFGIIMIKNYTAFIKRMLL